MNFFQYQDQARRQTRRLVVLFMLAVLTIVAVIDVVVLFTLGFDAETLANQQGIFTVELIRDLTIPAVP